MGSYPQQRIIYGLACTEEAMEKEYLDDDGEVSEEPFYHFCEKLNEKYKGKIPKLFEFYQDRCSYQGESDEPYIIGLILEYKERQILVDYGQEKIDLDKLYSDLNTMKSWLDNQPEILKELQEITGSNESPAFWAISSYG